MGKNRKTSEELLKECDVLLEECRLIKDSLWALLETEAKITGTVCEELLKECEVVIEECHFINDAIEGWLGTKKSFKEEILGNLM